MSKNENNMPLITGKNNFTVYYKTKQNKVFVETACTMQVLMQCGMTCDQNLTLGKMQKTATI